VPRPSNQRLFSHTDYRVVSEGFADRKNTVRQITRILYICNDIAKIAVLADPLIHVVKLVKTERN